MATLASDLVEEVRQLVTSDAKGTYDLVDSNGISGTATPLVTFNNQLGTSSFGKGSRFTVDLEEFLCVAVNGQAITAMRQMSGTTIAAHAANAIIRINPIITDFNILRALNQDIVDLSSPSSGLFQDPLPFVDLTKAAGVEGYDFPEVANFLSIYRITHDVIGISQDRPDVLNWRHLQEAPTTAYASGNAIFIYDSIQPGRNIRVHYKAGFSPLVNLTDNVATVTGMPTRLFDIPVLGAAYKLTATRETKRDFTETQTGRNIAQEVPAGAMLGASRGYKALRDQRVGSERGRLHHLYPIVPRY